MKPEALRHLRNTRDWTREEMAQFLGGTTASAIVKWERGERPVPEWVAEKLLRSVEVTFDMDTMQRLVHHAIDRHMEFDAILADAIRDYLARQPAPTAQVLDYASAPTPEQLQVADAIASVAAQIDPAADGSKTRAG